jgi:hypothetical protein
MTHLFEIKTCRVDSGRIYYAVYVDGKYSSLNDTLEEAKTNLEKVKENILNPFIPEVVHSEIVELSEN